MDLSEIESRKSARSYLQQRIMAWNANTTTQPVYYNSIVPSPYSHTMSEGEISAMGRSKVANVFRNDPEFQIVVSYLRKYARGKEKDAVATLLDGILSPWSDVKDLLVGAILDAAGYNNLGNLLIGISIIGLGLSAFFGALDSQ